MATPSAHRDPRPAASAADVAAVDALAAAFYALFDNRGGPSQSLDAPLHVFVRDAVIVRREAETTLSMTLEAFLAPRRRWLADGTLVDFHEAETDARTFIAGDIATRLSRYRKHGRRDGAPVDGEGVKSLQCVRTAEGWRIASVTWQDGAGLDWRCDR